jgi:hypothetical protein
LKKENKVKKESVIKILIPPPAGSPFGKGRNIL